MNLPISEPSEEWVEFLINCQKRKPPAKQHISEIHSSFSDADIQDMLSFLNPDIPYDDWIKVGMAIHAGGYGLSLWDIWSQGGSKYNQGECKDKWEGFSIDAGVSMGTLVKMSQDKGWSKSKRIQDISSVQQISQPLKLIPWAQLHQIPQRQPLVKGLLDEEAFSVVYGASNSGKTFFTLDLACHIALGWAWGGKKVKQGSVVYVAGEGGIGIRERLEAFRKHHEHNGYGDIYVLQEAVMLAGTNNDVKEFVSQLYNIPNLKLVIIDTLARAMGDGDENSAAQMGLFIKNCDLIRKQTKAHVMVVHHTGKDENRGARGSNSLRAAIDTEIQISQANSIITSEVKKRRDGQNGQKETFELKEYHVAEDEDGESVYSCALQATRLPRSDRGLLKGQAKHTYQVLCELIDEQGKEHLPKKGVSLQQVVTLDVFKNTFLRSSISSADKKEDKIRVFNRHLKMLKSQGYISECDGYVWVTGQSGHLRTGMFQNKTDRTPPYRGVCMS